MVPKLAEEEIEALVHGEHAHPCSVLGPHHVDDGARKLLLIRVLDPLALEVEILLGEPTGQAVRGLELIHPGGLFEGRFLPVEEAAYRVRRVSRQGQETVGYDPYAVRELLSDFDLYLLAEGTHHHAYEKLGAHYEERQGIWGTRFAVWAPNATGVNLIGEFNRWVRNAHPMEVHEGSGVWQLFMPGLEPGALYKYLVRQKHGAFEEKIDPYAFFFETPPKTAAIVFDLGGYRWSDHEWMENRGQAQALEAPLSFYEVHLGSWRRVPEEDQRPLTYRELEAELVPYVRDMGFTHLELLPITEHPYSGSWGYQTTGYFAPTSRFGDPDDFRHFVDVCHQNGIGVVLDWVPAHFPRDLHALASFDGTALYEHADPRQGSHPDWGTLIFNYGRNEVRNFLLSSALFWLDEYHLDGLRVDAVASMLYLDYSRKPGEWLPNPYGGNENLEAIDFVKRFNELVHEYHPGVLTIAEESTAWPGVSRPTYVGGLGFSLKWNMGWMHDSLLYMSKDSIHRRYHHECLTFSMLYAFSENFVLPLSHDEAVHGKGSLLAKMPGDLWQKFAGLRAYFGYMYGHPGKKLLFMGSEFGQWSEWDHDAALDWDLLRWETHSGLQAYVRDLNRVYRREPALHQVEFDWKGFDWIDFRDADSSVIASLRRGRDPDDFLVCVCNFTPVPRFGYRIGVPRAGHYREILNSDSAFYGGSNLGNGSGLEAEPLPWQGLPCSVVATVPPLATIILKPGRQW